MPVPKELEVNEHRLKLVHVSPEGSRPTETWVCTRCDLKFFWRQGILQGFEEKEKRQGGFKGRPLCQPKTNWERLRENPYKELE